MLLSYTASASLLSIKEPPRECDPTQRFGEEVLSDSPRPLFAISDKTERMAGQRR